MTREYPPYAVGNRLLVETALDLAESDPDRIYAAIPKTHDLAADGFRDVTFGDVKRMTTWLAGWIEEAWGKSSDHGTIAYLGVPDLRPSLIFFAAVMNGYKYFPPSPRNAATVNAGLLEQTKCSKIIYGAEVKPLADQLCALTGASALQVPSMDDLIAAEPREYTYSRKNFEDAKNDQILVLHSSGSTGLPKPIVMTNGTFAALDNEKTLPSVEGRTKRDYSIWDFEGGGKFFTPMPHFHLSGFLSLVINPVFTEASTPVIGPPGVAPIGALLKEVLKQQKIRAMYIVPFMAEQLLSETDGIDHFRGIDFVCYTGSPFSPSAGQQLVQVTDLIPLYGSTEAFQVPQLVPAKEDWAYMEWNPHFKHEMQLAEDGLYEMVLFADASTEKRSALNHNCPGVSEWRTRDLFRAHPSKPSLWQYYGRRDDIIVLWDGYKFNPIQPELAIGASKSLSGVLIIGKGRRGPALILEAKADHGGDDEALINEVWPLVEQTNAQSSQNYHIARSKILVVPPGTFVRAGKGTVIRKLSEQKLQKQIDELYAKDQF
ncbi:Long-chain-fatty-acid--CoA ligase [Cytospora mali]|uniref:Long-chain-fatty-acid--CoA ligase n=1 Tax=Cytospora mali TaxID=578113 RepID=A0A194WC75_CYTMA|nr:Long-chain-fatty-acid--CoA ligase [Valsa mali]